MLISFFKLAAVSPGRQSSFRALVAMHLVMTGVAASAVVALERPEVSILGHVVLIAAFVEGALLVGWRLTQMPRSQALEFLLVSPLRPHKLFLAETMVGLARLALLTLAGLPIFMLLVLEGYMAPESLPVLLIMPWTWGAVTGLALTTWAYENRTVRHYGERAMILLIVLYLAVGVLAAEHLGDWLAGLPEEVRIWILAGVRAIHIYSPFSILRDALQEGLLEVWIRLGLLEAMALAVLAVLTARAAARLQGHFQDRHYSPAIDAGRRARKPVGDKPLSWWAVKRVSEYSGRVNLWLAGGFGVLYAAFTIAGDAWPPWLGTRVFLTFDVLGGVPAVATALIILAAVPAAFQYGLWDSNAHDRCRRIELLLLTDLGARDYWDAACAAAWRRGRGYFVIASLLWISYWSVGRIDAAGLAAVAASSIVLWGIYFTLGFRAFARGQQANMLGLALTVGLPVATCLLCLADLPELAALAPPGAVFVNGRGTEIVPLNGIMLAGLAVLGIGHCTRRSCLGSLRNWYDLNHNCKLID